MQKFEKKKERKNCRGRAGESKRRWKLQGGIRLRNGGGGNGWGNGETLMGVRNKKGGGKKEMGKE